MSFEERISIFADKHNLGKSDIAELLSIWNQSLIDIAHGLLQETNQTNKGKLEKKWATKIAQEYATEHGLTLDDFEGDKITKKLIDEHLKGKKPSKSGSTSGKIKEKCHGLTQKGDPCSRPGSSKPDGAKNFYCFRHAENWQTFEESSDSSDDERLDEEKLS
tara:strand:- start:472 stop:957 length:486 start_codon:yes stop_codon:yes gene_type:complete